MVHRNLHAHIRDVTTNTVGSYFDFNPVESVEVASPGVLSASWWCTFKTWDFSATSAASLLAVGAPSGHQTARFFWQVCSLSIEASKTRKTLVQRKRSCSTCSLLRPYQFYLCDIWSIFVTFLLTVPHCKVMSVGRICGSLLGGSRNAGGDPVELFGAVEHNHTSGSTGSNKQHPNWPNSSAESIRHPGRLVCFPMALAWSGSGGANVHSARCSTIATWPSETAIILSISKSSFSVKFRGRSR